MSIRPYRRELVIIIALAVVTLGVYWQVRNHGFVNYDDGVYVTQNPMVRYGLTGKGLLWAFGFNDITYWHPLTWISHMIDCTLYGLNPGGHHFSNLLLHGLNSLLLFLALRLMTGTLWRSALVSALFALHPLNVEPVAWVAARKDVLSALFWMLALLSYALYSRRPGFVRYLLLSLCLALGLMAKVMVMTLPFVLLLLDYWPLARFGFSRYEKGPDPDQDESQGFHRASSIRLILEKLPLLALSAGAVCISIVSSSTIGIIVSVDTIPMGLRIANAPVSCVSYMLKTIWPWHMAVFYPFPDTISWWLAGGATLLLILISVLAFLLARSSPYFITGWFWFLGTLIPVIGLVQQGLWPALADRFTYLPMIGLFIVISWGLAALASKWRVQRTWLFVIAIAALSVFAATTRIQTRYWKSSVSLFSHALDVTTGNHLAHYNLASALRDQGNLEVAIRHYRDALRIMPRNAQFHNGLAAALIDHGDPEEAITHLKEALALVPDYPEAHVNMGSALARQGNIVEAVSHYRRALSIKPVAEAHHNLGLILSSRGKYHEAVLHYEEALRIRPGYSAVHNDLGVALSLQGKFQNAIPHFEEALRLDPANINALRNLQVLRQKFDSEPVK